jgi:outer membrane usher protein
MSRHGKQRKPEERPSRRFRRALLCLGIALALLWLGIAVALLATPASAADDTGPYEKPVSSKLNITGKDISMPAPLLFDGEALGDITVTIGTDDVVHVQKAALLAMLKPMLDAKAATAIEALPDQAGSLSMPELAQAGFGAEFDPSTFQLTIAPALDQRAKRKLSLRGSQSANPDAVFVTPAKLSGFVNLRTSLDHDWSVGGRDEHTGLKLEVAPTLRAGDFVLESEFAYDGTPGDVFCPVTAICVGDRNEGFKRRQTRLTYDWLGPQIRMQFGDAEPVSTTFQRNADILGVSIAHAPRKLAPNDTIRASGESSFQLEQASEVDVVINGNVVRNLRLRPGQYDLSDIPLQPGANTVELQIRDENGGTRSQTFTTFYDGKLLAPGKSEWAAAAGVPSYVADNQRGYDQSRWLGTAFLRKGILPQLTAEVQAQADDDVMLGGGGLLAAMPLGFLALNAAISSTEGDVGYGANAGWTLSNARILLRGSTAGRESLGLSAEYRSIDFRTPGAQAERRNDVLYPEWLYAWRFTGFYSVPLTETVSASLSARYQIAAAAEQLAINEFRQDRYGLDLTLSAPLGASSNGSLSIGYSNETASADTVDPEFRIQARLQFRPDQQSTLSTSYDSLDRATQISARRTAGKTINRWDASADVSQNGRQDRATASGSVAYSGNRFEARVSQSAGYDGVGFENFEPATTQQRTSLQASTAIAFADGHVAVGAPIRGGGFAIVHPHASLAGKTISVGDDDDPIARTDQLGPALVGNLPAYSRTTLGVDVDDLPVGYSLGQGAFDLKAPNRAGYALQVGSAYAVSAFGTLLDADGAPIALLTGTATLDNAPDKQVAIFTNDAGRFAADGLAPGRWIIEMATDASPTRFVLTVPEGTDGLFKAGTLQPEGSG